MITMQMREMKMLETRALFIGLIEALGRWHLCGIHIGATRETHGLEGKVIQKSKIAFIVERLKVCSRMCEKPWGKEWGTKV